MAKVKRSGWDWSTLPEDPNKTGTDDQKKKSQQKPVNLVAGVAGAAAGANAYKQKKTETGRTTGKWDWSTLPKNANDVRDASFDKWKSKEEEALKKRNAIGMVDPGISDVYTQMYEEGQKTGNKALSDYAKKRYTEVSDSMKALWEETNRRQHGATEYQPFAPLTRTEGQASGVFWSGKPEKASWSDLPEDPNDVGKQQIGYSQDDVSRVGQMTSTAMQQVDYYWKMLQYAAQMGNQNMYDAAARKLEDLQAGTNKDISAWLAAGRGKADWELLADEDRENEDVIAAYNRAMSMKNLSDIYGTDEDKEWYDSLAEQAGERLKKSNPAVYYALTESSDTINTNRDLWEYNKNRADRSFAEAEAEWGQIGNPYTDPDRERPIPTYGEDVVTMDPEKKRQAAAKGISAKDAIEYAQQGKAVDPNETAHDRYVEAWGPKANATEQYSVWRTAGELQESWALQQRAHDAAWEATNDPEYEKRVESGKEKYFQNVQSDWHSGVTGTGGNQEYQDLARNQFEFGLTDKEIQVYFAIYDKSPEDAHAYAEYTTEKHKQEAVAEVKNIADNGAISRFTLWMGGSVSDLAGGLFPGTRTGRDIQEYAQTALAGQGQSLEEKGLFNSGLLSGKWDLGDSVKTYLGEKSLSDASQLGTSILQSWLIAQGAGAAGSLIGSSAAGAGASAATKAAAIEKATSTAEFIGTAVMGSSAGNHAFYEKIDQGWDTGAAFVYGLTAGINEALFEYVSLDNLITMDITKAWWKNVLKQGFVEATEEMCTTIANTVSESTIAGFSGNETEIEQRAIALMGEGKSYSQAYSLARREWFKDLLNDAIGGFLSGGIMTGANYATAKVSNVIDRIQYGEYSKTPYDQRDAAWQEKATGKAAFDAEGLLKGNLLDRTAEIEGGTDAVAAYAKDNKVKVKDKGEMTEKTVQKVTDKLTEQMAATQDVATAEKLYQATLEKYGEGIRAVADQALSRATLRITREVGGNVQQTLSDHKQTVESIQDEKAKAAAQAGLDNAVLERMLASRDQTQWEMGQDYRRSRGKPMTMQATVTQADGTTKEVGIKSLTADNRSVVLEDGSTVKIDELQTDSDTKDVLQAISKSGMGGQYATDMLATYQTLKESGKVADPYRWAMDYVKAYDRGRVGEITLEETASYARHLDADTVKLAYEAGTKAGQTMKAEEKARVKQMLAVSDRNGATGHKGSVVAANADVEHTLATTKDQGLKKFVEDIRQMAEFFGVTVRLTESKVAQREFTDKNGKKFTREVYEGARGSHEAGVIEIDINSGKNFVGDVANGMLYTMAHEMTHFTSTYNPEGFNEIKRFAFRQIVNQKGQAYLDELIQKQLDDHAEDPTFTKTDAEEEVVAEFCQGMLTNKTTLQTFAKEAPKGFKAFVEWVKNFLANIREKLAQMPAAENELAIYQALEEKVKEAFGELWAREVMGAVQVHDAVGSAGNQMARDGNIHDITNSKGDVVAVQDGQGHMMEQIRTYEEDGRKKLITYLNAQVKNGNLTSDEALQIRQSVEEMYNVSKELTKESESFNEWSYADVQRTATGLPIFSWMKSNSEYGWSMDASLVCIKRRTLDAVFDYMIRHNMLDNFDMASQSVVAINDIIRSYGFETACGLCYIDAKRYRSAMVAGAFCDVYNELVRSMVPKGKSLPIDFFNYGQNENIKENGHGIDTMPDSELDFTTINQVMHSKGSKTVEYKIAKALKNDPKMRRLTLTGDWMSATGFTEVGRVNPELRKLYNAKKGSGGPKATEADTQYLHEIIGKTLDYEKYFNLGGLRVQSFSDYIPRLVFDYVEMVGDMAAKKLPSHAYSKELMFALQFGKTGMKINMSLIPNMVTGGVAPGLDADGNYAWRDGQSFGSTVYGLNKEQLDFYAKLLGEKVGDRLTAEQGFRLAQIIQSTDGYSQNCGTIAIGVSDAQIRKMLNDDAIRMVIPYHKSGLNHILASLMNVQGFQDYTNDQNTKKRNAKGEWANLPKGTKDFNINEYMHKNGVDAKTAADAYLAWCEKKGYKPKFEQFANDPGYYKVLVDFNCYDAITGDVAAQQSVQAVFPSEGDPFGDMKALMKMALQGEDVLQGRQDAAVPKIVDTITRTLPELENSIRGEKDEGKNVQRYEDWKTENRIDEKKYQLREYSEHQKQLWSNSSKIVVYDGNPQSIESFYNSAQQDSSYKKRMYFGIVDEQLAADIEEKAGYDFEGKNVCLLADEVRGIPQKTKKQEIGQKPSLDDYLRIPEVFNNPEVIEPAPDNGKPGVLFVKTFGNEQTRVQVVLAGPNSLDLHVSNVRNVGGEAKKRSLAKATSAKSPARTSKTTVGTAPIEILPQDAADVKGTAEIYVNGKSYTTDKKTVDFINDYRSNEGILNSTRRRDILHRQTKVFAPYQDGVANENNFFINTIAQFDQVDEIPVSAKHLAGASGSKSNYWSDGEYLYRESDHWGPEIASCDWYLRGINSDYNGPTMIGRAAFSDFTQKTDVVLGDGKATISTFNNTIGVNKGAYGAAYPVVEGYNKKNQDRVYSFAEMEDEDVDYNQTLVLTEQTVDKYLADYAAKSSPNYAQAYIVQMRPDDFLSLTTSKAGRDRIYRETGKLDVEKLKDASIHQPFQLRINTKTGQVEGHEGRHRAMALSNNGIRSIPVLLFDSSNKYSKTAMDLLTLKGQDFGSSRSNATVTVQDVQPLSYANRDNVVQKFTTQPSMERMGEKYGGKETIRYQQRSYDMPSDAELMMQAKAEDATSLEQKKLLTEYQARGRDVAKLEEKLTKLKEERDAWKEKAKHGGKYAQGLIDSKNRDIAKLEKQIQKYRDIMAGKLRTPELARMLRTERENAAKQMAEHKDEVMAGQRERRKQSALRNRIKNLHDEMRRELINPKQNKYIPQPLIRPVVDLLEMVNTDSGRAKSENAKAKIDAINTAYDKLKSDPQNSIYYDETVKQMLVELSSTLDGRTIYDLNTDELSDVYTAMKAMKTTIRNAVKADLIEKGKDIYETGTAMRKELRNSKGAHKLAMLEKYHTAQLSALRMFNRFGGYRQNSTWNKAYRMLDDAQLRMLNLEMQGTRIFDDVLLSKADRNLADKLSSTDEKDLVDIGLKDADGNTVKITRGMMLSLYMHLQNEENMRHIMYGGLTLPDMKQYYKGKSEAWGRGTVSIPALGARVSNLDQLLDTIGEEGVKEQYKAQEQEIRKLFESVRSAIEEQLTEYDRKWIADAKEFFDDFSRRELNKATVSMYGFGKARVDNYFPIVTDSDFLRSEFDSISKNISLENAGFMKERVRASNPILLEDLTKTINRQISNVARYAGMTEALKTFGRVYNVTEKGFTDSVKKAMAKSYGRNGQNYVQNLITDLVGGRTMPSSIFDRIKGNYAQAVLATNLSVTIKQAASYPTAAAVVGWKPLMKALVKGGRNGRVISRADRSMIATYTPLLWKRSQGAIDTEIAEMSRERNWAQKSKWLMGWIEKMDIATVGRLWYAAEYYVKDNFKNLEKGTEAQIKNGESEFYKKVAEVFNRIVEETQPNYTVMQRPDILRNPNKLLRAMVMFSTQRLQNANIMIDAAGEYQAMKEWDKQAKTAESKAARKEAKSKLTRAITSQAVAAIVLSSMTLLAGAVTHRMNPWRDDDDELTLESIMEKVGDDFISTLAGSFLWGSEAYDMIHSMITGSKYYENDVGGISTINSFLSALVNLEQNAVKIIEDENSTAEDWANLGKKQLYKVGEYLAQMTGIPVSNWTKILEGAKAHVVDAINGNFGSFEASSDLLSLSPYPGRSSSVNARRYLKAFTEGDSTKMQAVLTEMQASGKTEDSVKSALTGAAKDAYNSGQLSLDRYAELLLSTGYWDEEKAGNRVVEILKDEYEKGLRTEEDVTENLIRYKTKVEDENDAWKVIQRWETTQEHKDEEDYSYSEFENLYNDLDSGKSFEEAAQTYLEHGYKEENLRSNAVGHVKNRFDDGDLTEDEAIDLLLAYGRKKENEAYRKLTADEAWLKVQEWTAKAEHEDDEEYSYSQYDEIDAVLAKNGNISGLVKELTDHGVKADDVRDHVKGWLVDRYVEGNSTEAALKNQLSRYCGIVAKEDVDKILRDANCKKAYGVAYSQLNEEYRAGNISSANLKQALMRFGGMSDSDAKKKLRWLDVQKQYPDLEVSDDLVNSFYDGTSKTRDKGHQSASNVGMDIKTYVNAKQILSKVKGEDKDGNGKTDTYSTEINYISAISSIQGLTTAQRWALYYEKYTGANWKKIKKPNW